MYGKGQPLARASGRAAEGLLRCYCLQPNLADHPEACTKGSQQQRCPAKHPSCKTGDPLGWNRGVSLYLLGVDSNFLRTSGCPVS